MPSSTDRVRWLGLKGEEDRGPCCPSRESLLSGVVGCVADDVGPSDRVGGCGSGGDGGDGGFGCAGASMFIGSAPVSILRSKDWKSGRTGGGAWKSGTSLSVWI